MHNILVGIGFVLLILIPCLVAVFSSSKEGHSGNTGEHEIPKEPTRPRGHSPSRIREAAAAMEARKQAKAAAEAAPKVEEPVDTQLRSVPKAAGQADRPSRLRQAVAAAFTEPKPTKRGDRPSRIRNVVAALRSQPPKDLPMASGDPGTVRPSIREIRAKQAAAHHKPPQA